MILIGEFSHDKLIEFMLSGQIEFTKEARKDTKKKFITFTVTYLMFIIKMIFLRF